jgi:hypothetical protein
MVSRIVCVWLLALLGVSLAEQARAASWIEENFWLSGPRYDRIVPGCDSVIASGQIMADFASKEARFWNSNLTIVAIEDVHETAMLPWAAQSIPRRFCKGIALVSDGLKRPIYYSIAEDMGEIGAVPGVEFCVVGLDRNWAYGPACRAARR